MHCNIEFAVLLLFWLRQGLSLFVQAGLKLNPSASAFQALGLQEELPPSVDCYILPLHNSASILTFISLIFFFTKVQGI